MTTAVTDYALLAGEPVSPEAPSGAPLREDADFDAVQDEIRKLDSLTGEGPDWRRVVELSEGILRERSKDLRVASYCCIGLLATRGYTGLADGLGLLLGLIESHWSRLYPPLNRLDRRVKPLYWLNERGLALVEKRRPGSAEMDALEEAASRARKLAELIRRLLSEAVERPEELQRIDPSGGLRRLADAMEAHRKRVERPAATTPGAGGAAGAAAPITIETAQQARAVLKDLRDSLKKIARVLLADDPKDPFAYRLSRVVLWSEAPRLAADEQGRLAIPGPDPAEADEIMGRHRAQSSVEGLGSIEQAIQNNPYWLDLHHASWTLLGRLGSDYVHAAAAIYREVIGLVALVPELPQWSLRSGQPVASEQTRSWLVSDLPETGKATEAADDLAAVEVEARSRAQAGDLVGGLALLDESLSRCGNRQQRFRQRLRLARLARDRKQYDLALAQYTVLIEDMDRFGLDEWDIELCKEVLVDQLRTLKASGGKRAASDAEEQLRACRARLYRLAPVTAIEVDSGKIKR